MIITVGTSCRTIQKLLPLTEKKSTSVPQSSDSVVFALRLPLQNCPLPLAKDVSRSNLSCTQIAIIANIADLQLYAVIESDII